MRKRMLTAAAATAVLAAGVAVTPAAAGTGCNGVVNWFVWGCAGWDNNNGPQFPYYKKKVTTIFAPAGSRVEIKDGRSVVEVNGVKYPVAGVIAPGGANVIAPGGANVVAAGGANVVAAGGGNVQVYVQN